MATGGGDRTVVQVFRDGVLVNEYEGDPEFIPLHFHHDLSERERRRLYENQWTNEWEITLGEYACTSREEALSPMVPTANVARIAREVQERWQSNLAASIYGVGQRLQEEGDRLIAPWTDSRPDYWESERRAESLLMEHLTPMQQERWKHQGVVIVLAPSGKFYTLSRGGLTECEGRTYCIQPTEHVPAADAVLARKLLLESDEAEFLRIANDITPGQFYEILNQQPIMPLNQYAEQLGYCRCVLDATMPENEVRVVNGNEAVRLTNIGSEDES